MSRRLIASISRRTLAEGPRRFRSRRAPAPPLLAPLAPPQSTRCSLNDISPLPEFGANLPERDWSKLSNALWRQAITVVSVLAVPPTGKGLDDARRFPTVLIEGPIKPRSLSVITKSGTRSKMVSEFPAEIVVEAPMHQAAKKLSRQCTEAMTGRKSTECALYFLGRRLEERREEVRRGRCQTLDRCQLG